MSADNPQDKDGQGPARLPDFQRHITGHNDAGKAIFESSTADPSVSLFNDTIAFNTVYTTSEMPLSLNDNQDLKAHKELLSSGHLGLVNPNGTVCRVVDFGPGTDPLMHRTQSLDYGVVLEGELELILDDGANKILKKGDVVVQRATYHGWRNTSKTEWARMLFVLQHCQKVLVNGRELGEDLSNAGGEQDRLAVHHQ
ncbi:MAG: hypothetical protein Q9163_001861 [Psora crenata]